MAWDLNSNLFVVEHKDVGKTLVQLILNEIPLSYTSII